VAVSISLLLLLAAPAEGTSRRPFVIEVADEETGRGVPLVELRTTNDIVLHTDSNGIACFDEPGMMGRRVFFHVESHGYAFPKDGFGFRGAALEVREGARARLAIRRLNLAERLYRVTGAGIYRDSLLAGETAPIREPALSAQVSGCDSVVNALYRGKVYWFWGDTNRPGYPLGNFHTTGATSELPARGGLDPEVGIDLEHFIGDDGFARSMAPLPGKGPTWISGLVVLPGSEGERLFAHYVKVRTAPGGSFGIEERGLAEFDDRAGRFEKKTAFPREEPFPGGAHPFTDSGSGDGRIYFCDPFPLIRVRAEPAALAAQERYEAFTCLELGSRVAEGRVERDLEGRPRWDWKAETGPVRPHELGKLVARGALREAEYPFLLRDAEGGKKVIAHRGSLYWNVYRGRWGMIACEIGGSSHLGEVWYAEADRPLGPWGYARKVVTHDRYSFYNPKEHPFFAKEGGRVIYFEGTYTSSFSGNPVRTPRYDYNQILYRLDLSSPRLALPVAVYERGPAGAPEGFLLRPGPGESGLRVAFWALEQQAPGTVVIGGEGEQEPLFHVLSPEAPAGPATVLLHELRAADGRRLYAVEDEPRPFPGFERADKPLGRVWRHEAPQGP
jgi:hypothetical protein